MLTVQSIVCPGLFDWLNTPNDYEDPTSPFVPEIPLPFPGFNPFHDDTRP